MKTSWFKSLAAAAVAAFTFGFALSAEAENTDGCITFSSGKSFTLHTLQKGWNGTMQYSTDLTNWTTWDGAEITASQTGGAGDFVLYVRGTGNTVVTTAARAWVLKGTSIACSGNIETILDWETVKAGNHPTMGDSCFMNMFLDDKELVSAPDLPATSLSRYCYGRMFYGCTKLSKVPAELPATTLAGSCYYYMFANCSSLVKPPAIRATTLADHCCQAMFLDCTSLKEAPELLATTMATDCYGSMFGRCLALDKAPKLPAMTLANQCYYGMFSMCTNITEAPDLPATTLAPSCYYNMFGFCYHLTKAPNISATSLATDSCNSMFQYCTRLTRAPELRATTLGTRCYQNMFNGCKALTLFRYGAGASWSIPKDAVEATDWGKNMFKATGGELLGQPEIGWTYFYAREDVPIQAVPASIDNTTVEVYTNGYLSVETQKGVWLAWSNQTATAVYKCAQGYYFDDGETVKTLELDTTKDPAYVPTSKLPQPPQPKANVSYLVPIYVDPTSPKSGIKKWETAECVSPDYEFVTDNAGAVTWNAGFYVVKGGDVTISGRITCNGHVHLILMDGAKLTASAGITVSGDANALTVYAQEGGTGTLEATSAAATDAGIGGASGVGQNITINGGIVTAWGNKNAAGIGGGKAGDVGKNGHDIVINGGTVTAKSVNAAADGGFAAGIGGGDGGEGYDIVINGGTVDASCYASGAGIGGGGNATGHDITINGGDVTAESGSKNNEWNGAGIGGGCNFGATNIRINGGKVNAIGGGGDDPAKFGSGIGGGRLAASSGITVDIRLLTKAGDTPSPETVIENTGDDLATALKGKRYATVEPMVQVVVTAVEHTTATVFTADGAVIKGPPFYVETNATVTVVYTAEDGYAFEGVASSYETKAFTADKDPTPMPMDPPAAPTAVTEGIEYLSPVYVGGVVTNGIDHWVTNKVNSYATVTDQTTTWGEPHKATWYVVDGEVTIAGRITCVGDVRLILKDNKKLTASAGITVSGDANALTVYAQSTDEATMGAIEATGGGSIGGAGIGGDRYANGSNITINGGKVTANGGAAGIGGGAGGGYGSYITINGGNVTATCTWGAGIGGCDANGSNITINGGKVTATGGNNSAGIGGGNSGGQGLNITINGGTVEVTGGKNGAGIGGGNGGNGSNITISGGTVEAKGGGDYGAGIGGGNGGNGSNITINGTAERSETAGGCTVTATGGQRGAGLGGGNGGNGSNITISGTAERSETAGGCTVEAKGGDGGAGIGNGSSATVDAVDIYISTALVTRADVDTYPPTTLIGNMGGDLAKALKGKRYATVGPMPEPIDAEYVAPVYKTAGDPTSGIDNWVTNTAQKANVIINQTTWGKAGETNWYVVAENVPITSRITCAGDVRLILKDGATLTASAGITVSGDANALTIYGQRDGTGAIEATSVYGAGIGGVKAAGQYAGQNITINGGWVTATSSSGGAGIGGVLNSDRRSGVGQDIVINGGVVMATGYNSDGAGIGGGGFCAGRRITINGGTVEAVSSACAAIGGGGAADGEDITINGGTVTARTDRSATWDPSGSAVIGGGNDGGHGRNIFIRGGTVTAINSGYVDGVGIGGGGKGGTGSNISIEGGMVFVANNGSCELIGSGSNAEAASNITISADAKVFFNLVGANQPMPESFEGMTILTPETPVARTLVGGIASWTAAKTFNLTNAVTAATGTITVNDMAGTVFSEKTLWLPIRNGKLALMDTPPPVEVVPTPVEHATATVFTADGAVIKGPPFYVELNTTVTVVYTAEDGYAFQGGASSFETEAFKAETDPTPMPVAPPAQPAVVMTGVEYLSPVYVGGIVTSGLDHWVTCKVGSYTTVTDQTTWGEAHKTTWYVVEGDVTISSRITCAGDVRLILKDGATLNANAGITVTGDAHALTVYVQSEGTGALEATGGDDGAGIGGCNADGQYAGQNITINGGQVTATSGKLGGAGIGGFARNDGGSGFAQDIVINGGHVKASAAEHRGAGIGGGGWGAGRRITINGGIVEASSASSCAGIGGGGNGAGEDITINGGTVTAMCAANNGAGIGGGDSPGGQGRNIRINGGTVTATGGSSVSAGIGNGGHATTAAANIYISMSLVTKADVDTYPPKTVIVNMGGDLAGALKGQRYATVEPPPTVVVAPAEVANATVTVYTNGVEVAKTGEPPAYNVYSNQVETIIVYTANDGYEFPGGATTYTNNVDTSKNPTEIKGGEEPPKPPTPALDPVSYLEPVYVGGVVTNGIDHWETNKVSQYTEVTGSMAAWGAAGQTNWYVVVGDVTISSRIACLGDVRLILKDNAKLTANAGITASPGAEEAPINYLGFTVYAQSKGATMGKLVATGGNTGSGIGGLNQWEAAVGQNITINGGVITATGCGTGIGGSGNQAGAVGKDIVINGGKVTATCTALYGAGIGGGGAANGERITINGGTVKATGHCGAGIGGGGSGAGVDITINGGTVKATGGYAGGAGVGGGDGAGGTCDGVRINGGTVTAIGGNSRASGIGKGGDSRAVAATNIFIFTDLLTKADNANPPQTLIENKGGDLADKLSGNRYATVAPMTVVVETADVPNATVKVYYADGEIVKGPPFNAYTNEMVTVVYTAEDGYAFGGGESSYETEAFRADTDPTPMPMDPPKAPTLVTSGIEYLSPVYAGGIVTNGIDRWVTCKVGLYTVVTDQTAWGEAHKATWYVVEGEVTIDSRITCEGDVRLILADGATLNANAGITVSGDSNALTVYAQSEGTGVLVATNAIPDGYAGIGGEKDSDGQNITINGGTVTTKGGGNKGAGIGGGEGGAASDIIINGGDVSATGHWSSGIGGGDTGDGANIVINGGRITASNDSWGAALGGGGGGGVGKNIRINGGMVFAGATYATAIGSGSNVRTADGIYVSQTLLVKADDGNPPKTVIENTGDDLTGALRSKHYATIEPRPTVEVTPKELDHATAHVYTNGVEVAGPPPFEVVSNALVTVRYEAEEGYFFPGGTNAFETEAFEANTNPTEVPEELLPKHPPQMGIDLGGGVKAVGDGEGGYTVFGEGELTNTTALAGLPITNLVIGAGITSIGDKAFYGWRSIRDVRAEKNCITIGVSAFAKCYNVTNMVFSATDGITVGDYAFLRCNSLDTLAFAGSDVTFGKTPFALMSAIYMKDGMPVVYPIPQVTIAGYTQVLYGATELKGAQTEWTKITTEEQRAQYHFFQIRLEK